MFATWPAVRLPVRKPEARGLRGGVSNVVDWGSWVSVVRGGARWEMGVGECKNGPLIAPHPPNPPNGCERTNVPVSVKRHTILSNRREDIIFTVTAEQVILSLIDGRFDVSFFVADAHPFFNLWGGVVCETQLVSKGLSIHIPAKA